MSLCKEIREMMSEAPNSISGKLIKEINSAMLDGMAGKKFNKVTGAFSILSKYIEKENKIKDADERDEFIRTMKKSDAPKLEDVLSFAKDNDKLLGN